MKALSVISLLAVASLTAQAQNPYLPLWEHLPDGEPRVFEDPDQPGKMRAYIIGSHDMCRTQYCGVDVHMWSAPVEDLSDWRDEGAIFTYFVDNQWDIMYAPDLVEVRTPEGKKEYVLYPHCHSSRIALIAKSDRPNGPFKVTNATEDGRRALPGSIIGFDPSVFVEPVVNPNDPDSKFGYRAYAFWGFMHSTAAQLDQTNMYTLRPGTQIMDYFIPASRTYGVLNDPVGTTYPALYKDQKPGDFNFFEASSIRQVDNKYVMVFSGYSGPEYGQGSTNSALRYAYSDSPLGPWRSGGVLVDSRAIVRDENGSHLMTSNAAHNTHGSIQQINGQWYVFYHRPPRGFGNARQSMVAPIQIHCDETSVAAGGKVEIRAYDPYAPNGLWTATAADGNEYTGAEVTSEGFQIFGLDPYQYYSAGIACFMTNQRWMQDTYDWWDNSMELKGIAHGGIVGFKYFGFEGLKADTLGCKAFEGVKKGDKPQFNVFLTPRSQQAFRVRVMLDEPWNNAAHPGKEIAVIDVPANAAPVCTRFTADVTKYLQGLKGKHAIYLVADGTPGAELFDLQGIGFSKGRKALERPVPPVVQITVDGKALDLPALPVPTTKQNGYTDLSHYEVNAHLQAGATIEATCSNPEVKIEKIVKDGKTEIKATYKGLDKIYLLK